MSRGARNEPRVEIIRPISGWISLDIREIWAAREILYFLVWRDIKVRYKQTVIGIGWAVLQPVLTMLVFSLFFGRLAHLPSAGLPYPLFYLCGVLPWTYFATAVTSATASMIDNQRIISKIYFPRLLLPMAATISGLLDLAIAFGILAVLLLAYHQQPNIHIILIPAFVVMATVTAFAVGLWLSAANAIYRDVRYVMPFLVQFWLFASPVVYPANVVPSQWRWLYGLNPMAGVIDGFRWAATGSGDGPGPLLFVSLVVIGIALVAGLAYFSRMESTVVDTA